MFGLRAWRLCGRWHPKIKSGSLRDYFLSTNACVRGYVSEINKNTRQQFNENIEELFENSVVGDEHDRRNQSKKFPRPKIDPRETTIILFPGQGAQFVGMGKKLINIRGAKDLYDAASEVLGYNLFDMCLNGPKEKLDRTEFSQPAIFVTSLAAIEQLKEKWSGAVESCVATAGYSVGEITALVFADAIPFEKAVKLVQIRGEAMQAAADNVPGGMITVFYGPQSQLGLACLRAKEWCVNNNVENPECHVASYLFPHCKVVAGNNEALQFIKANAALYKLKHLKPLPVSGAFHTSLMRPAVQPFREALKEVDIQTPAIAVYSNVDGGVYSNPRKVVQNLPKQICKPVKWEQLLHNMYERPVGDQFPTTYECGPGNSLKSILKMVNAKAWHLCETVET